MTSTHKPSKGPARTPKVIKTEDEYEAALGRVSELFDAKPGTPQGDELELLVLLVEKYEETAYPIGLPDPLTAIRFRMEQQVLSPADMARYLGSELAVRDILAGRRKLTLPMIRKLNGDLDIPVEVLIQEPRPARRTPKRKKLQTA